MTRTMSSPHAARRPWCAFLTTLTLVAAEDSWGNDIVFAPRGK